MPNGNFDHRVNCWINYRLFIRRLSIDHKEPPREWGKIYTDFIELFKRCSKLIEWQSIFIKIANNIELIISELKQGEPLIEDYWLSIKKDQNYIQYLAEELMDIVLSTDFVIKYASIHLPPKKQYDPKYSLFLKSIFKHKNNNKKIIECICSNLVQELSRFEDSYLKDPDYAVSTQP